jgi:flagellar hook assembly protein FlgD
VEDAPPVASLGQNYPNPFNPSTTIPFVLERHANVVVEVFDVRGGRVATLVDEALRAGAHQTMWDGPDAASRPAASGVYFVRLRTGGTVVNQKLLLLK